MLQEKSLNSVKIRSVDYDLLIKAIKTDAYTIKAHHPLVKKIFLFGSFSKGNFTPDSDVDLLIIVEETVVSFLQRRDIFIGFFKNIPFDVNLLVYTKMEIKNMQAKGNHFINNIMKEAIELI